MQKIKIFLASSEDLTTETLELSDLVEHLNWILEGSDIHIYLCKWEYLQSKEDYDDTLDSSDLSLVIFGKDFGTYSEEDLKKVYERVCKEVANPQKLYVYFKAGEDQTEALKKFRDSFPEQYGHFTGSFVDVNALRADFMLQFQLFQNQNHDKACCEVKVKDGRVYLCDQQLEIDLIKVPFLGNNEKYKSFLYRIEKLEKELKEIPTTSPLYNEKDQGRIKLLEEKRKYEENVWKTALEIVSLNGRKISELLDVAIKLFNDGDIKGANTILNSDTIKKDLENERKAKKFLKKASEIHDENIKKLIDSLKLKVKTLQCETPEGWVDEVLDLYEEISSATKEVYGEKSYEYFFILSEYLSFLQLCGIKKNEKKILKELIGICQEISLLPSSLRILFNSISPGNKYSYLRYCKKALKVAKRKYGLHDLETAQAIENLANAYFQNEKYKRAWHYAVKSVKLREQVVGAPNIKNADCLILMAELQMEYLDYEAAIGYLKTALELKKFNLGDRHLDLAFIYNHLGKCYSERGEYKEAEEMLEKSVTILRFGIKTHGEALGITLNNLAQILIKQNKNEEAMEFAIDSLKLRQSAYGEMHAETALSYNTMGLIYGQQEEWENALENGMKALEIQKAILGETHPDTGQSYNNVSVYLKHLNRLDQATQFGEQGFRIRKKLYGLNHPVTAESIHNLAGIYQKVGNFGEEIKMRKKAVRILISSIGTWHPRSADAMICLGEALVRARNYKKGFYYLLKSEKIQFQIGAENHILAETDDKIGDAYEKMGDYGQAIKYKAEAIRKYEESASCFWYRIMFIDMKIEELRAKICAGKD